MSSELNTSGESMLLGTFGEGLLLCQPKKCRRITEADGLPNNNILAIDGSKDSIWLASLGGVSRLAYQDLNRKKPMIEVVHQLGDGFIYQVQYDDDGHVWVASHGDGLARYQNGAVTVYDSWQADSQRLELSTVLSIASGKDDSQWVNSQEHGIMRLRGDSLALIDADIRQISGQEDIMAIIEDELGQLLVIHPQGVSLYAADQDFWLTFGSESGFSEGGAALNAARKGPDGNIWFVAGDRLVKYRSEAGLKVKPVTAMQTIYASGYPISRGEYELAYDQNYLVFDYRGNWLTDQRDIQYRYFLRGHDQDWIFTTDGQATYSNLTPGRYSFWVESGINGQFSGVADLTYDFVILKPWWLRWWAFLIFGMLLAGIISALSRWQRRRKY